MVSNISMRLINDTPLDVVGGLFVYCSMKCWEIKALPCFGDLLTTCASLHTCNLHCIQAPGSTDYGRKIISVDAWYYIQYICPARDMYSA